MFEFPDNQQLLHKGMKLRIKRDSGYEYWVILRKRLNKIWVTKED